MYYVLCIQALGSSVTEHLGFKEPPDSRTIEQCIVEQQQHQHLVLRLSLQPDYTQPHFDVCILHCSIVGKCTYFFDIAF